MREAERLLEVLGQVKEEFIAESAPRERIKKVIPRGVWVKWLATAACVVLVMGITMPTVIETIQSFGSREGAAEAPAADAAIEESAPMEEEAPAAEEEAPAAEEECAPIITADENDVDSGSETKNFYEVENEVEIDMDTILRAKKDTWGLALSVKDATPTGATVVFVQEDIGKNVGLACGVDYWIEKQSTENPEEWSKVEAYTEPGWIEIAWLFERGKDYETKLDWDWLYGELEPGTYRIVKKMQGDNEILDRTEEREYYAEFTIK